MTVNIYDSANQIEREIRQLPEFVALKEAFTKIKADSEAFELFKQFRSFQQTLQQKQMNGEEFSDDDAAAAQQLTEKIQSSQLISDLMQKEQVFSTIIGDVNNIIMKPVQELYGE